MSGACYFTENVFVRSPIQGHFKFEGVDSFREENAELLANLTLPMQRELIANLEAETQRRRSQPEIAEVRKRRLAREYTPLHPELWTLKEEWLHPDFVSLVRGAQAALDGTAGMSSGWQPPPQISEGVYALPVLSERFCSLLCEELDALAASGLPCGQPNSMNRFGALLDELGFTPGFTDPLMRDWLRPLCAALPPLAAVGGASLDMHRAFVVRYRLGEDESLSTHFDNAEVTLNANLGVHFEDGELLFYGHKDSAGAAPVAGYDWAEHPVGHGVLHLGQNVHAALPITSGDRRNLVVLMRSSAWRRRAGCPMCGETRRLLRESPY